SGYSRPGPGTSSRWCPRATCSAIAPPTSTGSSPPGRPCHPTACSRRRGPKPRCGHYRAWIRRSGRPASTSRRSSPTISCARPTRPIRMAEPEAAPLTADATPAITLREVACTFVSPDAPAQRYTAVENVGLTVGAGEFVSVVGPTGCGKSTLLNVAAGLLEPSRGEVEIFGERLLGINRRAGYMFQADSLMPWRTARDNVLA